MKICAVQSRSKAGDVAANISGHLKWIEMAALHGVDLVFFPELSLTGYEPSLAAKLATTQNYPRFDSFQQASDSKNMVIGVGMPLSSENSVQIGTVWFTPTSPRRVYTKQILHEDELVYFTPGREQLILEWEGNKLAPAICYESLQPQHAEAAAKLGANVYLTSVAKSAGGLAAAELHYPKIALANHLDIIMANSVGSSDNFTSAGQSAAWSSRGTMLAQMDGESQGCVVLDTLMKRAVMLL